MKAIVILALSLMTSVAMAKNSCLSEAKIQARIFSAANNRVAVSRVIAKQTFLAEQNASSVYYGVLVNVGGIYENINVGLNKKDCTLATEPNYVTDGL